MMEERRRKQQYLEEQYYQEKRKIQRQQQELSEQIMSFRKETGQIIDKVMYLTKNDHWNKQQFYRAMEMSDSTIQQEGHRYAQRLEEKERELTKEYRKEIEKLQENK